MPERIITEDHIDYKLPFPNYDVKASTGDFIKVMRSETFQRLVGTVLHKAKINTKVLLAADEMVAGGAQLQGLMLHTPRNGGVLLRYQNGSTDKRVQFMIRTPTAVCHNDHDFHARLNDAFTQILANSKAAAPAGNGGTQQAAPKPPAPPTPPAQPAAPAADSLEVRITAYRTLHGIGKVKFSELCGISPPTLEKLIKGEPVRGDGLTSVEAVLAGRTLPQEGAEKFDATTEQIIAMMMESAKKGQHLDELVRLCFNRLKQVQSEEDAVGFAHDLLRKYLASEDPTKRVAALLELRDMLKPPAQKPGPGQR